MRVIYLFLFLLALVPPETQRKLMLMEKRMISQGYSEKKMKCKCTIKIQDPVVQIFSHFYVSSPMDSNGTIQVTVCRVRLIDNVVLKRIQLSNMSHLQNALTEVSKSLMHALQSRVQPKGCNCRQKCNRVYIIITETYKAKFCSQIHTTLPLMFQSEKIQTYSIELR